MAEFRELVLDLVFLLDGEVVMELFEDALELGIFLDKEAGEGKGEGYLWFLVLQRVMSLYF